MAKNLRREYDPFYGKRKYRAIEKLQPNPKKKRPPKRAKKSLKVQAQNQPRDQAGKFAKIPVSERGFFGKLRALANGEMRRHINNNRRRAFRLTMKHVHGIDLSRRRKRQK